MNLPPDQMEKLLKDVAEIKSAVIGDERYGHDGIAKDVNNLKKWRDHLSGQIKYLAGFIAATWFIIGVLAYVGVEWVKYKFGLKE
jgi:hypothetical protein